MARGGAESALDARSGGVIAAPWLEIAEKVVSITAIVIGAAWVYLNTLLGRVFKPKLAVSLEASHEVAREAPLLRARISIENNGLTQVAFHQSGTALTLRYNPDLPHAPVPLGVTYGNRAVFPILEHHSYIEPGVTIVEELLLQVPTELSKACELRLTVATRKTSWSCTTVLGDERNASRRGQH